MVHLGLDGLEKRLDKVGRFFRKGRGGAREFLTLDGCQASHAALSDAIFRTFPQPSFIRPTSTRMLAREEVSPTSRHFQRSPSLPQNSPSSSPTNSQFPPLAITEFAHDEDPSSPSLPQRPQIPRRTSSLSTGRRSASLASLAELLASNLAPSKSQVATMELLMARSTSGSVSPRTPPNNSHQYSDAPIQPPISRSCHLGSLATPPPSAEHNKSFGPEVLSCQNHFPLLPPAQLTPAPSPRLVTTPNPGSDDSTMDTESATKRPQSLDVSAMLTKSQRQVLRRSTSLSTLQTPKSKKRAHPVLQEPTFGDFLTLSDDDIADNALVGPVTTVTPATTPATPATSRAVTVSKPPDFALPPNPPCPFTPPALPTLPQSPTGSRMLTLSPPLASLPATAAAFESARIASKYKFDLVYVVNLWPNHMVGGRDLLAGPPSPPATPKTYDSAIGGITPPKSSRTGMNGRLLAAHGLHRVPSPFRIVAPVHMKALRTDDWLEFRSEDTSPEEFQRGFMHSFFTGHCPSPDARGAESPKRRRGPAPNRGIVFVAHRLPNTEQTAHSEINMSELQADAENLVLMLLNRRQIKARPCITVAVPSNTLIKA